MQTFASVPRSGSHLVNSSFSASDPHAKHDRINRNLALDKPLPRSRDPLSATGRYPPITQLVFEGNTQVPLLPMRYLCDEASSVLRHLIRSDLCSNVEEARLKLFYAYLLLCLGLRPPNALLTADEQKSVSRGVRERNRLSH